MRSTRRARSRWALLVAIVALTGLLAVTGAGQAQDRIQGNVLGNASSPIGFAEAEDTVIEEADEGEADDRVSRTDVALRGEDTMSEPGAEEGRRDYLLGLSASAAIGIAEPVLDRYRHGQVEDAFMQLNFAGGCSSPNGQLTVRAITNRSWSPFDVGWEDTTRSDNGTLEVMGPELASVAISAGAAQSNADVTCSQATFPLENETLERVLEGEHGGLAMFWSGQQELNVSTANAGSDAPEIDVNLTTDGPSVHDVVAPDGYPYIVDTGERVRLQVNASDPQGLPDDGVRVAITPFAEGDYQVEPEAQPDGDWYLATHTFPNDAEGRYAVEAVAEDGDGWTHRTGPNASGPHLVADGSAPEILEAQLADADPNATLERDQDQTLPLQVNVSDLSCRAQRSPCGSWRVAWNGTTLANGTLDTDQRIDAEVPLTAPGNATARLVVEDVPGHANESTTWTLDVADTQPPDAEPVADTHLAPGRSTTLENGTAVRLSFEIQDDLPVQAELRLTGTQTLERSLPDHDDEGRVQTEITDLPEGTYQVELVLDDGTNERAVSFGELTIAPAGAPSVSIDHAGTRIGPQTALDATVRDRDLDEAKTRVVAEVDGLEVQPEVETTPVEDGQDLVVKLGNLSHEDDVNLDVRAEDNQGLSSRARAQLTVDARPPALVEPSDPTWVGPDEDVRFHARDDSGQPVSLTIDAVGTRVSATSPRTVSADRVAQTGQLSTVEVTASDDVGNQRIDTLRAGIDESPPEASPAFTADGLVIEARDAASGVRRVDASVSVNDGPFNETQVFQESPSRFFVSTGPLTRGDEITLAAQVRDQVGHVATVGTPEDPRQLTVPDRPPEVSIERASEAVGDQARVNWTATDPDEDPLDVTLRVEGPSGDVTEREVDRIGTDAFEAEEPGRHTVTVEASSAGNTSQASTFFHLAPDGRLTQAFSVPESVDPGSSLTVELTFPAEPREVYVTATDEQGASTSAQVTLEGERAEATFEELPEGRHDLEATVVHEEGAVETVQIASVNAEQPIGDRLADLVVPLLVMLAVGLVVVIVAVWYKRRQEEEEAEAEHEADPGPS
jgi:hypothetical protein